MAFSGRAATLLRSVGRGVLKGNAVRFRSTGGSTASKILPLLAGSVTAVCVATGASYYTSKVLDTGVTCSILDTVHASPSQPPAPMAEKSERTFIMIKPDGVHRGLIADIIKRFEQRGYKLVAMKFMQASEKLLQTHYEDLSTKPFFPGLVKFMSSGPVVAMVWEGKGVVAQGRALLGETDPLKSAPGSIRGDYSIDIGRNIVHGSDSVSSAKKEIGLWFQEGDLVNWSMNSKDWVYE